MQLNSESQQNHENISSGIAAVLHQRQSQLPSIESKISQLHELDGTIKALETLIVELKDNEKTSLELKEGLSGFSLSPVSLGIANYINQLEVVKSRFSRKTINIGVSGAARMGKSTLLQAISGLGDEQIPTGNTLPVTAVKSRILHNANLSQARIHFHDYVSFREHVIDPYHKELGLSDAPHSIESFSNWPYPNQENLPEGKRDQPSSITLLKRLKTMQAALPSYQSLLVGVSQTISLSELRKYVAYPTPEQENNSNCERPYLAVKDVHIECKFPYAQVSQLGIIDLPGLGELAANAEAHHVKGLRNDVDLVLLVKRPATGMGFWGFADGKAADLLDLARKPISIRKDFTFLVVNSGGSDIPPDGVKHLKDSIRREANENEDNKNFVVLEADAANQESVYKNVLEPVLVHLNKRLPVMDKEVLDGALQLQPVLFGLIKSTLGSLKQLLSENLISSGNADERLDDDLKQLHENLAGSFFTLQNSLYESVQEGTENEDFITEVNRVYKNIDDKISNGLGTSLSMDEWCVNALSSMRVSGASSVFATTELNRLRVEISNEFHELDDLFQQRIDGLWNDVSHILLQRFGQVLDPTLTGKVALELMADKLESCGDDTCPSLTQAVRNLLELRLEYRAHLHPRVRENLDGLRPQTTNQETDREEAPFIVPVSYEGCVQLFKLIRNAAQQAAFLIEKAIIAEIRLPDLVVFAAFEQFDDSFIRSGQSERELKRFARTYKNEIWPGVYQTIMQDTLRIKRLSQSMSMVAGQLEQLA